ncbi:MAG: hypothetical protein ACI9QD_000759 [Thermoproteota archaeon]|jgi:hypothetical protein
MKRIITFILALSTVNAFAINIGKQKISDEDIDLVTKANKLQDVRVYLSKRSKVVYEKSGATTTNVDTGINTSITKEKYKVRVSKRARGKIISILNGYSSEKTLHISFDEKCTNLLQKCTYTAEKRCKNDTTSAYYCNGLTYQIVATPKNFFKHGELVKGFDISSKIRKKIHVLVKRKDLESVIKDSYRQRGW